MPATKPTIKKILEHLIAPELRRYSLITILGLPILALVGLYSQLPDVPQMDVYNHLKRGTIEVSIWPFYLNLYLVWVLLCVIIYLSLIESAAIQNKSNEVVVLAGKLEEQTRQFHDAVKSKTAEADALREQLEKQSIKADLALENCKKNTKLAIQYQQAFPQSNSSELNDSDKAIFKAIASRTLPSLAPYKKFEITEERFQYHIDRLRKLKLIQIYPFQPFDTQRPYFDGSITTKGRDLAVELNYI